MGTFTVLKERLRHCNYVMRVYDGLQQGLPFVGHWNDGSNGLGFSPAVQTQLILDHKFILPWFNLPAPWLSRSWDGWKSYYQDPLQLCSRLQLPITLRTTQWEDYLLRSKKFSGKAAYEKVRVPLEDGTFANALDLFGESDPWAEAGRVWATESFIPKLFEYYEEPPVVLFLGNNEASVYRWEKGRRTSMRYKEYAEAQHGTPSPDDILVRNDYVGAALEKYGFLLLSLRANLPKQWQGAMRPVWYGAHESFYYGYGRGHWNSFSPGGGVFGQMWISDKFGLNFEPSLRLGVSAHCYMSGGWKNGQVLSPQIGSMVYPMMVADAYKFDPNFWFEISYWDGTGRNEPAVPDSLKGWLRLVMWVGRPKVIRGFRYSNELAASKYMDHLKYAISLVEEVHNIEVLKDFWLNGSLVIPYGTQTPFRAKDIEKYVPEKYWKIPRWFLLDTPDNPSVGRCQKWPECERDPVEVYAVALKREDEYLICGHRSDNANKKMSVLLPMPDGTSRKLDLQGPDGLWYVTSGGDVIKLAPI